MSGRPIGNHVYVTIEEATEFEFRPFLLSRTFFDLTIDRIRRTRSDISPTEQSVLLYESDDENYRFSFDNLVKFVYELEEIMKELLEVDDEGDHGLNYIYCKELHPDGSTVDLVEQEPLHPGRNDVVTRISEAAVHFIRNAMALGRKQAGMVVTIDKISVLPHDEFVEFFLHTLGGDDDPELDSAVEQSLLESEAQSLAADESAVEALEKLTYDGGISSDHGEESKCVICMEELMSGSQLIRMPCSHLFHGDCIKQWLQRRNTCPLCRFSLPSSKL